MERFLSEHAERTLVRLDAGGFSLEAVRAASAASAAKIDVVWTGEGWRVAGEGPWAGWVLSRVHPDQGGGLQLDAEGDWVGRTLAFAGSEEVPGLRHLLLADGRLFRMMLCRPRNACFELRGWETSGAYLTARPGPGGWTLTPTPAGDSLDEIEAIQILFAAEIHQSDSGHEPATCGESPGET